MLRKLMSLLALGFLLYAMCLALMWARQETLLFPGVPQSTADYGTGVQHLWLTAPDGIRLHAWYRPAISAKGTLLYFGGNAEEVHTHLANPERFAGWNLILVDYRGYAQSQAFTHAGRSRTCCGPSTQGPPPWPSQALCAGHQRAAARPQQPVSL